MITLESIFSYSNLYQAKGQVIANRGAAGTDGLTVDDIEPWFKAHPHKLTSEIKEGTYQFQPIKRVYIPKHDGKMRPLGIPSVIDRIVLYTARLMATPRQRNGHLLSTLILAAKWPQTWGFCYTLLHLQNLIHNIRIFADRF